MHRFHKRPHAAPATPLQVSRAPLTSGISAREETMAGNVPIFESVGAALRYVRENGRFVLTVGAAAAIAQGVVLLLGANLLWIIVVLTASVFAYTALIARALNLPAAPDRNLIGHAARVGAAMAIVGLLLIMLFIGLMFLGVAVLTAPYQEEIKAAAENQAALNEIMSRALTSRPEVMSWTTALAAVLVFAITTRFYLSAPATADQRQITVFDSWRATRGNFLRIAGARLLLLGPAFVFVSALQTLLAYAFGMPAGDPIALVAQSRTNPIGFAVFYTLSFFLQVTLYSALEAGLSSYLYRGLKPAEAQAPPA
jgi:hypothetical protein